MYDLEKRINEALGLGEAPAAPPKPVAPPKPSRPKPQSPREPKPSPFNPPRPAKDPEPKNAIDFIQYAICEAYEDETHPSTQQFWGDLPSNKSHIFAKHPILSLYGNQLSRSSWEHTKDRARRAGTNIQEMMQIMMQIKQLEATNESKLIDLAKRITHKIWNIPMEMLQGDITGNVDTNVESDTEFGHDMERPTPEGQRVVDQINKRLTLNTLTQGSAVHAMLTIHHAVDQEIQAINPDLLQLYNKLSSGSHEYYWLIDIPAMFTSLGMMAAGSAKVEWPETEGDTPKIVAKAVIFPILAQEMSKGVAELISAHGLSNLDADTTSAVLGKADDIRHEPYLIQVGPQLWREFLKVKPREAPLADIMQALALQEPNELHRIVTAVIEEPDHARQLLNDLITQPEEFDIEDYEDYDDHGGDTLDGDEGDDTGEEWKHGTDYE